MAIKALRVYATKQGQCCNVGDTVIMQIEELFTDDQLQYLVDRGLPWSATGDQTHAFAEALDPNESEQFAALGIKVESRPANRVAAPVKLNAASSLRIDRSLGTIQGVAVIQAGMTKPSGGGHGSFLIDNTTLQQVTDAINAKPAGVKVRVSHPEVEGTEELLHRVGYLTKARRVGTSVIADFTAYDPENSHVRTLMSIAETDPASCGMSIVATDGSTFEQNSTGQAVLRVTSLDAVDFVGEPAACHTGLLAASAATTGTQTMITTAGPNAHTAYRDTQDALLIACGCPLAEFDQQGEVALDPWNRPKLRKPSTAALALSREKLVHVAEQYLRAVGPPQLKDKLSSMTSPELARLSMSRSSLTHYFPYIQPTRGVSVDRLALAGSRGDYPYLLSDTLNKMTLIHFANARRSWRAWAKRGTVKDFKQAERVRIEDAPGLIELAEGESIEFGILPEKPSETLQLATFARGLQFTRQMLLNDDTNALGQIGVILGEAAGHLEDKLAYGVLTANANTADGNALFSTAHGNVSTGAIGITSLAAASAKISNITNANGDTLDLQPAVMLVPSEIKYAGEVQNNALADVKRHESETQLKIVSSSHLSASSASAWFLGTDPSKMAAVEMTFLQGSETPYLDSKVDFDTDGMMFKIRHDVQAAAIDPRLMVRSTGA